jgi:two-component system nitrogen regulation response regulator GlnG
MPRLLIIDDEPAICWGLKKLGESLRLDCATASSAEEGLRSAAESPPDVIVLDVRLPGMDGISAMEQLKQRAGLAPIIVITAHGDLSTAVEAVHRGAFDYLAKPFDLDQFERVLERALDWNASRARGSSSDTETSKQQVSFDGLVGRSTPMQDVFKRVALVAASEACVLVSGESGTGKELIARAIHRYSRRSAGPFVAVNVASLSSSLAESELFGHVRGAFTGAEDARAGLLTQADGGTLFLDEVADIPLPTQIKLLRSLEHGEILPVGATRPIHSNFRVVSATHQNLRQKVAGGTFRHDLLFRLCAFEIELPPLRMRQGDLRELAEYFAQIARPAGQERITISPEALAEIERRRWPGNVRELRNAIEHALILARGETIRPEHLPVEQKTGGHDGAAADEIRAPMAALVDAWAREQLASGEPMHDLYARFLQLVEPPLLQAALEKHFGQCAAAARALGMHRTTLKKKLDEHGIAQEP